MPKTIRLAIISDLHVYEPSDQTSDPSPSTLPTDLDASDTYENPILSLKDRIGSESLTADYVLCCGDICDKAQPGALLRGWEWIHEIAEALGAKDVLATAGNHDMDSRSIHDHDARGALQSLIPLFPINKEGHFDQYWSRHFTILDVDDDLRFVLLNSAAYHGYRDEEDHGRISARTLAKLRKKLEESAPRTVNILLCHHHPMRVTKYNSNDRSDMEGGDLLLEMLGTSTSGRWLIVHGHRHAADIMYAGGLGSSPVVFAAGSFSATLWPELEGHARNQFYIVEISIPEIAALQLGLVGRVRAWDWTPGIGWEPGTASSGIPSEDGFGNRRGGDLLADDVAALLDSIGKDGFIRYSELIERQPALRYALHREIRQCANFLESRHGIRVAWEGSELLMEKP